jgi:hypothetical protein
MDRRPRVRTWMQVKHCRVLFIGLHAYPTLSESTLVFSITIMGGLYLRVICHRMSYVGSNKPPRECVSVLGVIIVLLPNNNCQSPREIVITHCLH